MPTFDGDNLIMTLDAPVDGVLSLDTQADWYSEWKKWQLLDDNLRYEKAFDIIISEELTPGIESGAYFFFRNDSGWRVRPFEADATIYLNGNLVPRDSSLPIMIPTIGPYTVLLAGLQPITQNIDTIKDNLETATYQRNIGISIDPINGVDSGAAVPGNREYPVKTEEVLHELLADKGFREVYALTSLSLYKDHSVGHTFYGDNPQDVVITLGDVATYPLKSVAKCKFVDCYITGELDSLNELRECIVGSITNANGFIYNSTIIGPIVLNNNLSIQGNWIAPNAVDFSSDVDFDGLTVSCGITGYQGGNVVVKRMVTGSKFLYSGTGHITFDSTCTGGDVEIYGDVKITNNGTFDSYSDASTATQVLSNSMTENYPVDGQSAMTLEQALYSINQALTEFQRTAATISVKKRDATTEAYEITLDDATAPTSATQSS